MCFGKIPSIDFMSSLGCSDFKAFKASTYFIPWSSIVFICFWNAFPSGEYANLANLFYFHQMVYFFACKKFIFSISPDENADVFAASLLIPYFTFSSLILSSTAMICFYVLFERLFLKREELSDTRVVSVTKSEHGLAVHFLYRFIKSWKSIPDDWINAVWWRSRLFGIFIMK